jgi:hypothetical protein
MNNEIIQDVAYDNYDDFQHVNFIFHYEKKRSFAPSLATHCIYMSWVLIDKLHELQLNIYTMQLLATQL